MKDRRRDALVARFYLHMMGTNMLNIDAGLLSAFVDLGSQTTVDEVVALLGRPWRETAMGAWYSLFHDPEDVGSALRLALRASQGRLTSPALSVAAVVMVGPAAIPSLRDYISSDLAHQWGASGFAAAAVEHLGAYAENCEPNEVDRAEFSELLTAALAIRARRD